jgi:hypothetical protein
MTAELFSVPEPVASIERHPFTPGEAHGLYCATCRLPRANRRHLPDRPPGDAA